MYLRIVIDFILEVFRNNLEKDDWNVFNLLLIFVYYLDNFWKVVKIVVEVFSGMKSDYGGDLSKVLFFNIFLI